MQIIKASANSLIQIGFRLSGGSGSAVVAGHAGIEETLLPVFASLPDDRRLASITFTWIKVHGGLVDVRGMVEIAGAAGQNTPNPWPWLTLAAAWAVECGHARWQILARPVAGPVYFFSPEASEAAIKRKGEMEWCGRLGFRIPNHSFRIRERDVMTPRELSESNPQYRSRLCQSVSMAPRPLTLAGKSIDFRRI